MKIVNNIIEVKLNHSPYHLASGSEKDNAFLVAGKNGQISLFNKQGIIQNSFNLAVEIESIDFDDNTKQIGFVSDKGISIVNFEGVLLHLITGNFKGILVQDGCLWSVRIIDQDYVQIEVYRLKNYHLISTLKIEDLFGTSAYMFFAGFDRNTVVLWMAGGQDGQLNFLVNLIADKLTVKEVGEYDTLPIDINPKRNGFLNGDYEYCEIYSYPDLKLKKYINFQPEMDSVLDRLYIDDYQILIHLSEELIIYNTRFNSVNRVNLFRTNNPSNTQEKTYLCEDFFFFQRFGQVILIATRKDSVLITDKSCFEFRNKNQLELPF